MDKVECKTHHQMVKHIFPEEIREFEEKCKPHQYKPIPLNYGIDFVS